MHRILLQLGPFTVYSYGFMLALAFIVGTYLAQVRARRLGIDRSLIMDMMFYILISSLFGARLLFVALNFDYFKGNLLEALKIWEGGLVFYGGLISGFLTAAWFLKKHRLSFWKIADLLSPSLAVGIALGRIGCLLNGCCYGKISERFGICFPGSEESPAFIQQVADKLIPQSAAFSLPVIPTQAFDSLSALALFCFLLVLERKKRSEGYLFLVFVLWYSVSRFIIEGFRFYESNFMVFGAITVSQLVSVILFFTAAILFFRKKRAS